jgi:ribosome biogenesis GTPase
MHHARLEPSHLSNFLLRQPIHATSPASRQNPVSYVGSGLCHLSDLVSEAAPRVQPKRESVMTLEALGWNDRLRSLFAPYRAANLIPARVILVDRGVVTVETESATATVSVAGQLDSHGEQGPPAVGDWVGMDLIGNFGVVHVILPRAGALARRPLDSADDRQVAAANVDLVLVVEPLDRGPDPWRIERASAIAWDGGAKPIVVLNKLDLCEDADSAVTRATEGAPFVDVLMVSAKVGVGVEMLAGRLGEGTTAVLLGPPGAGKSSLTDRLLGREKLAAAGALEADREDHYSTTSRELFVLPSGACLIDTPGVRELGLSLEPDVAMTAYGEIEEAARKCFLGDFRREMEPGWNVRNGVDFEHLNANGIASYLRLRREAEDLEKRRDSSRREEARRRERRVDTKGRKTEERKEKD